jgi:predicted acylesterase/phospholipase RssA
VGTSMGAVIGALYAGGLRAAAIDSLVRAPASDALFLRSEPEPPRGWTGLTPLVIWQQGERGFALQSPSLRGAETAALLNAMLLRANLLARGGFDALPIPLRVVATDLATREPVVLSDGDLARAVRASAAVPLVFPPERIAGRVLADGGLSANVPIGIARRLGAARVIVSDVSADLQGAEALVSPLAVADQLAGFLFQQRRDSLGPADVLIRPDVKEFRSLDFDRAAVGRLVERGRQAADRALGDAACLPRAPVRASALPSRVGAVEGEGLRPAELRALRRELGLETGAELQPGRLADRLRRLRAVDAYQEVWLGPHGGDTVAFRLDVVRAPRRTVGLDLAYDNELGGRMAAAALDRALLGRHVEGSAVLTLGRYVKDLTVGVRRYLGLGRSRLSPALVVRGADLGVRQFTPDGVAVPDRDAQEASVFVGVERELGSRWVADLGFDGRVWRTAGVNGSSGGVLLRVYLPTEVGHSSVLGEALWTGTVRRLHGQAATRHRFGRLDLGAQAHLGWGEKLPLQSRFALGGYDGFPGLHLEELRGDREVLGAVQASWLIRGPVSARLLVAAGRSAQGGPLVDGAGWLGGARAGFGADTPVGPVAAEYGVATNGRNAVFIRVGRWF